MIQSSIIIKTTAVLFLLSIPSVCSHAIWQQTVKSSDGKSASTLFMFEESPGLDEADEDFTQMASEKDINAYFTWIDFREKEEKAEKLSIVKKGRFIVADLPEGSLGDQQSYALESSTLWGVHADGTHPPMLVYFYTGASKLIKRSVDIDRVTFASKNKFVSLLTISQDPCEGKDVSSFVCIEATAEFDGLKLPMHEITLYDGDTAQIIVKGNTTGFGNAFLPVPRTTNRIFGKVKHDEDISGVSDDGEKYDLTTHIATSFLELTSSPADYPDDVVLDSPPEGKLEEVKEQVKEQEMKEDVKEQEVEEEVKEQENSTGGMFNLVIIAHLGLMAFIGSFLGGFVVESLKNHRDRSYDVAATDEVDLKIRDAESC